MSRIDELSEGFKLKYKKFAIGCDAFEDTIERFRTALQ